MALTPRQKAIQLKRKPKRKDKGGADSDFVCQLQFMNHLPELPFEPKFLKCPMDEKRYIKYEPTTLERDHKQELVCGIDVGVCLDLIDVTPFIAPKNPPPLDPIDQQLIDGATKSTPKIISTSILKKEYRVENYEESRNMGAALASKFTRKVAEEANVPMTKEKQIEDIIESFKAVREKPKHPTNPQLKAVEIIPLLPDEDIWGNDYSEVVFDSDPLDEETPENTRKRKSAIIKSVNSSEQNVLRYFVKRRRVEEDLDIESDDEEHEVELEPIREYTYRLHKGENDNFLFIWKENEVTYSEIRSKVVMTKASKEISLPAPARVTLTKLPFLTSSAQQQLDAAREVILDKEGLEAKVSK